MRANRGSKIRLSITDTFADPEVADLDPPVVWAFLNYKDIRDLLISPAN